jgi:hypothetical protein
MRLALALYAASTALERLMSAMLPTAARRRTSRDFQRSPFTSSRTP